MKYLKLSIITLFLLSCSNLQLRFITKIKSSSKITNQSSTSDLDLIPNIIRDENSLPIFEVKDFKTNSPSKIENMVWNEFSLMGIKLVGTIVTSAWDIYLEEKSTLKGIQKRFGKTKVVIPRDHHDGNNICYKDNKKGIVIKFHEDFYGGPQLGTYKVSKEKDISKFKNCLSIKLENVETKSGLRLGMIRQDVEKLFNTEPFKSAKSFKSRKQFNSYSPPEGAFLTAEMFNNNKQIYYDIKETWKVKCPKSLDSSQICMLTIYLSIDIQFESNKVSSFNINAEQEFAR